MYDHGMIGIYFYLWVKMFEVKRTILCLDNAQNDHGGIYFHLWVKFFTGKKEQWKNGI